MKKTTSKTNRFKEAGVAQTSGIAITEFAEVQFNVAIRYCAIPPRQETALAASAGPVLGFASCGTINQPVRPLFRVYEKHFSATEPPAAATHPWNDPANDFGTRGPTIS